MNWGVFWATLSAILVGAATNELCDVAPWLAKRILRRAARLEAANRDEESLLLEELLILLEEIPGKISKLIWSLGRLGFSSRFVALRSEHGLRRWTNTLVSYVTSGMVLKAMAMEVLLLTAISILWVWFDGAWARFADVTFTVTNGMLVMLAGIGGAAFEMLRRKTVKELWRHTSSAVRDDAR